ncbi:YceI family protein [Bacteroidota bacterium]
MQLKETINWVVITVLATVISCTKSPERDEAITGNIIKPVERTDTTEEYLIDTLNSFVTWIGTKPTGRHNGVFRLREGALYLMNDTLVYGKITIDMSTVDILDLKDNPVLYNKLLAHIKSKDLLDIKNYPSAEFELVKIETHKEEIKKSKGTYYSIADPNFMVTGNLTMCDSTLSVSFPARINVINNKLEGMARFNLDRTDWGIDYMNENDPVARAKDSYFHNKVNIGLTIIARNKSHNIF